MSSEESNKMSKKIPSQDLNFENPRPEEEIADDLQWNIEDMYDAYRDAADDYEQVMKQLEDENSECKSEGT